MIRIVTVCEGNVCRSPYLQHRLGTALHAVAPGEFEVLSRGTAALEGQPIDPEAVRQLEQRGLSAPHTVARQLEAADLEDAQLVLTAEVGQRDEVIQLAPRLVKRAFTLIEFVGLLGGPEEQQPGGLRTGPGARRASARWNSLPPLIAARRARADRDRLEIPDPYGQGAEAFRAMAEQIDEAVTAIAGWEFAMRSAAAD